MPVVPLSSTSRVSPRTSVTAKQRTHQPVRPKRSSTSTEKVFTFVTHGGDIPTVLNGTERPRSEELRQAKSPRHHASVINICSTSMSTAPQTPKPGTEARRGGGSRSGVKPETKAPCSSSHTSEEKISSRLRGRCNRAATRKGADDFQGSSASSSVPLAAATGAGEVAPLEEGNNEAASRSNHLEENDPISSNRITSVATTVTTTKGVVGVIEGPAPETKAQETPKLSMNRGPRRAAAAVAVARLSSSLHEEEKADMEEEDEARSQECEKEEKEDRARQRERRKRRERQKAAEEKGSAFTSGLLESLSGEQGPRSRAQEALSSTSAVTHKTGLAPKYKMEDVWTAFGAAYFQDPLVVKVSLEV